MASRILHAQDLIEVLCGAHLSVLVDSPYEERGGIMLVGPPGMLKSTFLGELDRQYADALNLTDLNAKALAALRDRIAAGVVRTLVFPEYAKIYERKDDTASNLEGAIRALVSEGFTAAAFEDQRVNRMRARAMVIGAITPATQGRRFERWEESGFNRRFLWPLIRLRDPHILDDAVLAWRRIDFRVTHIPQPPLGGARIPNLTVMAERRRLQALCKHQPGGMQTQQVQLLTKILAVLKWWYQQTSQARDAMDVMEAFGVSLGKEGADLELAPLPAATRRRVRERERVAVISRAAKTLRTLARKKPKPKRRRRR